MSLLVTLMTVVYCVLTSLGAPTDVTCIHGNVTYAAGQQFKPDACTTCHCNPRHTDADGDYDRDDVRGGHRPLCVVEDCTATTATVSRLNCRRLVKNNAECCPRCEEPGCLYKGRFYAAGTVSKWQICQSACPSVTQHTDAPLQCRPITRNILKTVRDSMQVCIIH